jgi:predicted transcriptional regulator
MASAIVTMLERAKAHPQEIQATARAEAGRLFATEHVCQRISDELQRLVSSGRRV